MFLRQGNSLGLAGSALWGTDLGAESPYLLIDVRSGVTAQTIAVTTVTAGAPTKFASASMTMTVGVVTAGAPTKKSSSTMTITVGTVTAGARGTQGASASTWAFTTVTAGQTYFCAITDSSNNGNNYHSIVVSFTGSADMRPGI